MKFCLELKKNWLVWLFFIFWLFFFSFRLIKVPPGINIDESSIGYNASLIADTLHDENGRFLPVFFLTIGRKDWKQPIRVYSTAIMFKLFGTSYYNLRLVSVIMIILSSIIFFLILRLFFNRWLSLIGLLLFMTSPSVLIQSHLAFDNVDLLPLFLLWLFFLLSYSLKPKNYKLVFSGIFLGLSFYTYKAAHAIVPVYSVVSVIYLLFLAISNKRTIYAVAYFIFGLFPFLLPISWLQTHYAGAIYDPNTVGIPSFFDFILRYLSTFDFSFLFVKGDKMLIHSTGRNGVFLIPCLFLFFTGIVRLSNEKKPWYYLILFLFALTPLLLTVTDCIYRAHRILVLIPLAGFIFTLGVEEIINLENKVLRLVLIFLFSFAIGVNYFGFVRGYWNEYPKLVSGDFSPNFNDAFKELSLLVRGGKTRPYLEKTLLLMHRQDLFFFEQVYFPSGNLQFWEREKENFPQKGLVLTDIKGSGKLENLKTIPSLQSGQKTLYIVGAGD